MMRMTRRALLVSVSGAALLAACGGSDGGDGETPAAGGGSPTPTTAPTVAAGSGQSAGVLRIGMDVDAGSLDPRLARDTTAYRVTNLLYSGLVQLDQSLQPQPDLAESWEYRDDTTLVFHLRDDVVFSDGERLTADDVAFTFTSLLDESFQAPFRSLYSPIAEVRAVDDVTVEFRLSHPYSPLLSYLDIGIVPKHIAEAEPDRLASQPLGSGPYQLESWERGSIIRLVANPRYYGQAPTIQSLEIVVVPDNTARAQALESGDLDLILSPLSPQDIRRLRDQGDTFVLHEGTAPGITYLNFNCADPVLSDARVRRAIAHLVDQQTIVGSIFQDRDTPATSILLPVWWCYTDSVQQPTYDVDEAERLLTEAGWVDSDGDGIRERDGQKLAITLRTHSEDSERTQTVEFLQAQLSSFGIDASVMIADWPAHSASVQSGDYQIALQGWLNLVDPDRAMYGQLHSSGGLNWGKYANPELDALLEAGRTHSDPDERARDYQEAAAVIGQDVPYYVLSYQGFHLFHTARLTGFRVDYRGFLRGLLGATVRA